MSTDESSHAASTYSSSTSSSSSASSSTASPSSTSSLPHYSVLGVGILTSDIVLDCPYYPTEDESIRAFSRHLRPGGNASNSLRIFSQLAASPTSLRHMTASTTLLACLGSADSTAAAVHCLHEYGIDTSHCPSYGEHPLPTSYIVNSQRTGSRTIVHYRGELPELNAAHFIPLAGTHTLYHSEGRSNVHDIQSMMAALTQRQQQHLEANQQQPLSPSPFSHWPLISLEVEKPRPNIDTLFHTPNLLILSHDYATTLQPTATSPQHFLTSLPADCPLLPQPASQLLVVCWVKQGAGVRLSDGRVVVCGAEVLGVGGVVDSVGAGDCFIGGLLYGVLGLCGGMERAGGGRVLDEVGLVERLVGFANSVAAAKCRVSGIDLPKPVIEQLVTKLYSDQ